MLFGLRLTETTLYSYSFHCFNQHSPPHTFCFAFYGLLPLFNHPDTFYEESEVMNLHCTFPPLPSDTLLPPPLSFCFSYTHSISQIGFPLLKVLELIHVASNRKLVVLNNNIHLSKGDRSLAP